MSIRIGTQLVAPAGFQSLESGTTYHFLKSDSEKERVLLVSFIERMVQTNKASKRWHPRPMPHLTCMSRMQFEFGVQHNLIRVCEQQLSLPPWLADLQGVDLLALNEARKHAKRSHQDRIDAWLGHIWPLLCRLDEVLGAADPCQEINRHARTCDPRQNETRLRLAFFCYLVFGQNRAALHYAVGKLGKWDRLADEHRGKKFGRPPERKGRHYGFPATDPDVIAKIEEGYRRFSGLGISMARIYRESMTRVFGCRPARDERDRCFYYHPEGLPFPSKGQFSARVVQLFGRDLIHLTKYGSVRTRNRMRPSLGKFTESVANLMEKTENDGYWCEEVARGYIDGEALPKLCVVRMRCATSGMLVGIGFSFGGETAAAYRMARFCAAIDKVKFCALFGITITATQWPSIGLPSHSIDDRGPGSSRRAQGADPVFRAAIAELAPSWSGQSKAGIESSHPRSVRTEGKPTYISTDKTLTELAVREIYRLIRDNDSMYVGARFNPEHVIAQVGTTPLGLWNYLDGLGRNDAIPMAFDDAVRTFLTPVEVTVCADGVYLEGLRYDSAALRETQILQRAPGNKRFKIGGYYLDACLRHMWVDVEGRLVEVDAHLAIASDTELLFLSIVELNQLGKLRREAATLHDEHRDAAISAVEQQYEDAFGHRFDDTKRRAGRAKTSTAAARQEAKEAKRYFQAGRRR